MAVLISNRSTEVGADSCRYNVSRTLEWMGHRGDSVSFDSSLCKTHSDDDKQEYIYFEVHFGERG